MTSLTTVYAWPPTATGLPSASASCIQVEAYLRLAGVEFMLAHCSSTAKSPTGQLPALERDADVPSQQPTDLAAARACVTLAKRATKDLDTALPLAQRAEVLAWSALVEHKLDPATEYSCWVEPHGYSEYSKALYQKQPIPLRWVLPWAARRDVLARHSGSSSEALYEEAGTALTALADKLRASGGPYLLGPHPSSVDALVFGHLLFYRSSPAAAPRLHEAVTSLPALMSYVDYVWGKHFQSPVPVLQPGQHAAGASGAGSSSWSDAAKGQKKPAPTPEAVAVDKEFARKSWWWLGGAAATVLGYVLLSGQYAAMVQQLAQSIGSEDDDDDGDDDDDDDQHDD